MSTKNEPNRVLNWGLLSTARINRSLIPALRLSRRAKLVGVASRDLERAETYAREWRIPHAYGSYEAMLADPAIDVVYNSLPNHLHAEWSIRAAQAGKHVLCEKPLALTLAEVDAITAAARANNVIVAEAFMYYHHPQTHRVIELLRGGEIGALRLIRGEFSFTLDRPNDIRWNPAYGGGSIWDIGCYPISYSLRAAGQAPVEVFGWQVDSPSGVDLTFTGQLRFADGVISQFDSSFGLPSKTWMELRGTTGELRVVSPFFPHKGGKLLITQDGKERRVRTSHINPYLCEVNDLAAAVLDGAPQGLPLQQSRVHIASILALLESARTGKPVLL